MRLIDADRALEIVRDQGIAHPNAYHLTNYATLILREATTIDVVPVVRCRECTEFDETEHECSHWYGFRENDFCSYGKRKEGADRCGMEHLVNVATGNDVLFVERRY